MCPARVTTRRGGHRVVVRAARAQEQVLTENAVEPPVVAAGVKITVDTPFVGTAERL